MIQRGDRVVWSDIGKKMMDQYHFRCFPKTGVFTVEDVIEWPGSDTAVRLRELSAVMPLKALAPYAEEHDRG